MADAQTILDWLKEAGGHAFQMEAPGLAGQIIDVGQAREFIQVDILVNQGTVGVRAIRGERREYQCLTWRELEEAESNPLIPLIDALAALVRRR